MAFTFSAFFFASFSVAAQERRPPVLIDEFGRVSCELFRSSVDTMLSELARNPGSRAVVVNRGERLVQLVREDAIRQQIDFRKFDKSRIEYVRTIPKGEFKTELWSIASHDAIPAAAEEIDKGYGMKLETPRILFQDDPDAEGVCPEVNHRRLFGLILNANPDARGNIVVRGRTRRESHKMRAELLTYLTTTHQIRRSRLRIFTARPLARYAYQRIVEYWYLP